MDNEGPGDLSDDAFEILEPFTPGPSGYITSVNASSDVPGQPFIVWVYGPELDMPLMVSFSDLAMALRGAALARERGVQAFVESLGPG
jgi:hypothetical protein